MDSYDVLVIGGGFTGIHQLLRLRQAGFSVRLLEAGGGVGGTWYWNRYPEARSDSEIYTYGYLFDPELWDSWQWSEHFGGQPEIEAYFNHVVERYSLADHIDVNARVANATFDEAANRWQVTTTDGREYSAWLVVTAVGILSAPYDPPIPGRESFRGEIHHTGQWPTDGVPLAGKRVAVIGTGASGVQIIPPIAREAASLTVYQRTANWVAPLNNGPITEDEQTWIRSGRTGLQAMCDRTFGGFMHPDPTKATFDDSDDERRAHYDAVWDTRGLTKLFSNYTDLVFDKAANTEFCTYIAGRIRAIVTDPATAEMLIPRDHGYGEKRPPMGSGYYETFNLPTVDLIDLRATPIIEFTERGLLTAEGEREFDVIVLATGFDAVTGSLTRMDIRGLGGQSLARLWDDGPLTYLGLQAPGFPNLIIAGGPHSTYGNVPRSTGDQVEFITDLIAHMRERGAKRIDPDDDAVKAWTDAVYEGAAPVLTAETAWYIGSNIPGKAKKFLLYIGGLVEYRRRIAEVKENDYQGFVLS
ncbi:NAD(P)/FAD-dependent oxidoreductase [Sporichthya sp.]|uniref:flavin-containing monooxygenase n=1 Tax=Sporichthya sp. TaxID=65475 RepID=UPI0017AEAF63|nr:NAD(P)/FAD-dependent oxidoreductase [Sporichthya sp.]MBA3743882.1 NAD(P)/FAD-dependent oxidoreductase [Sporichthya sp.]